jgi:DNA-binding protein YbaB
MAINLAKKYESQILTKWQAESFLAGKVNDKYSFAGVRSITIYSPVTVDLSDYSRTATANRFGTPVEMQDTIQELTLSQDKSFSITIDKGNNADQLNIKGAGEMLALQIKEKMVPHQDKYAILAFVQNGGKSVAISAPAVGTIVTLLANGLTELDNQMVPDDGRFIYLGATNYNMLRLSTEFLAVDPMAEKSLGRGIVGSFMNAMVVKVPDSYMPAGVPFFIMHRDSGVYPMKLKTLRVLSDVAGIDGSVLEGRNYFDAFVLGQKAVGIYVAHVSGTLAKYATPTTSYAGSGATVTLTNGAIPTGSTCYFTTDGSDPRYSATAKVASILAGVTPLAIGERAIVCFKPTTPWTTNNTAVPANFSLTSELLTTAVRTA